jgi:hypothetical protein
MLWRASFRDQSDRWEMELTYKAVRHCRLPCLSSAFASSAFALGGASLFREGFRFAFASTKPLSICDRRR